jgi:hypothetical protein
MVWRKAEICPPKAEVTSSNLVGRATKSGISRRFLIPDWQFSSDICIIHWINEEGAAQMILAIWMLALIIIAAFAYFLGIWNFGAVPFVSDVPNAATKVVASLLVVTLFTERCLAAINAAFFGAKKKPHETKLRELEVALDINALTPKEVHDQSQTPRNALAEFAKAEEAIRIAFGFCFAVLVSTAGVRTLAALVMIDGSGGMPDGFQKSLAHMLDIALTAGLIAGGSDGLAKLLQLIKDGLKPPPKLL